MFQKIHNVKRGCGGGMGAVGASDKVIAACKSGTRQLSGMFFADEMYKASL